MNKRVAHLLDACGLGIALSLLSASTALAHRHPEYAAARRSEGHYAAVFGLKAARPNPRLTPGALDPAVDQDNIHRTICVRGYSKSIRPPEDYTERLKRRGIRRYGYRDRRLRDYEEDHLVSLELGGSPTSPRNLWPEPHHVIGGWGSYTKDRLEDRLHALVCRGRLPLVVAQREIARDWISAYKRYIGLEPHMRRARQASPKAHAYKSSNML